MSGYTSAFTRRLQQKLNRGPYHFNLTQDEVRLVQRAFVETLKEEVESRQPPKDAPLGTINGCLPLVIAGLGSFKMRTRPQRTFNVGYPAEWHGTDENQEPQTNRLPRELVTKPPARRLFFTAKWEEIK